MRLYDAHCHLQDERLAPGLDAVLARARVAGLAGFCCCGSSEQDWDDVARLAEANLDLLPAFGIHPWYAHERTGNWLPRLRDLLSRFPNAPVGEIGLDHAIDRLDRADQTDLFKEQLALAREFNRPACLHCRRAWETLIEVVTDTPMPPAGFLIHSYSGSAELIPRLAAHGAWFSFSGSITYSNNRRGHQALQAVPRDRLLIETDSPDLLPFLPEHRINPPPPGAKPANEPAHLPAILQQAATLLDLPTATLAEQLAQNSRTFFRLP